MRFRWLLLPRGTLLSALSKGRLNIEQHMSSIGPAHMSARRGWRLWWRCRVCLSWRQGPPRSRSSSHFLFFGFSFEAPQLPAAFVKAALWSSFGSASGSMIHDGEADSRTES